jgi:hypothetical protein
VLFVAGDGSPERRSAAVETARAAAASLASRGGDPRIRVAIVLHRAAARIQGDMVDGPLTEIYDLASNAAPGVLVTDGFVS